jgi:uncharacterized protein (TIGR01777 family)
MKVVASGGTGFLGRALGASLTADGHSFVALPRDQRTWPAQVAGADVVINLGGESIAGRRWSEDQKRRILDSRVDVTRALVEAARASAARPKAFISSSAVGYYGPHGDEVLTEDSPAGSDFLAEVCVKWEAAAQEASTITRVVCVRGGLVLERDGGPLAPMLPPFTFGVGGKVGSGRQWWSWIHRDDWIRLVRWAIDTPEVSGAVNATAPNPVMNEDFARTLGRAMHRPALMPAPAFALRLLFGEMADALLLTGQRVMPSKATRLGFKFKFHRLDDALGAILQ